MYYATRFNDDFRCNVFLTPQGGPTLHLDLAAAYTTLDEALAALPADSRQSWGVVPSDEARRLWLAE